MRKDQERRDTVFPWGDARTAPEYAMGEIVYSGDCAGRVVSVDAEHATIGVVWSDGDGGAITYPVDATYLRKEEKFPWAK